MLRSPAGKVTGFAAQRLGKPQRIGDAVALFLGQLHGAPPFDVERHPGSVQAIGEPLGIAHETGGARIFADAYGNALAGRPRPLNGVRLHFVEQLLVHPLGGAAQREFAQCGEVGRREEVLERALGLLGDVDLAFLEALDQVVGRQIDQLDRIGTIEHGIRHGFAHAYMSNLRDDVVEAFDMLDIDRGIDFDAVIQQLFDVEIALRVAAAFGVGVGKLVDQDDLRLSRNDRIQIHFLQRLTAVFDAAPRNDFETSQQRFGFLAAVGLDHAGDDVVAVLEPRVGLLQHFVGLADAGRGADKNPQLADTPFFAARRFEERFR